MYDTCALVQDCAIVQSSLSFCNPLQVSGIVKIVYWREFVNILTATSKSSASFFADISYVTFKLRNVNTQVTVVMKSDAKKSLWFTEKLCWAGWFIIYLSIYLSIYGSTALVDLGRFFSFLIYIQSIGLLGRGSAHHKAAIYTQDNTDTE
jgi:hypothetical protein